MGRPWTITWGERSWTDNEVLAGDMASIQLLLGGGWENVDPWAGPLQLMGTIAALETRASGRELLEVMAEVRDSPATELLDAIQPRDPAG